MSAKKKKTFMEAFKEGYEEQKKEIEKDTATTKEKIRKGLVDGTTDQLSPYKIFPWFW